MDEGIENFYLSNIIDFYNIDYLKDILIESDTFTNELETFFLSFYNQYADAESNQPDTSEINNKLNILIKTALIKQFDPLSLDDSNLPTTSSSQLADNDDVASDKFSHSDKLSQFNKKLKSMKISENFFQYLNRIND